MSWQGRRLVVAEQVALSGNWGKKEEFVTFGRRGRKLRRTTRMS